MENTSEGLLFLAESAKESERYEDMKNYALKLINSTEGEPSHKIQSIFSEACRKCITPMTRNLQVLNQLIEKEEESSHSNAIQ